MLSADMPCSYLRDNKSFNLFKIITESELLHNKFFKLNIQKSHRTLIFFIKTLLNFIIKPVENINFYKKHYQYSRVLKSNYPGSDSKDFIQNIDIYISVRKYKISKYNFKKKNDLTF